MRLRFAILPLLILAASQCSAVILYPGITGRALIDSLRAHYKTSSTIGYDLARDKMYGEIDITADSLTCVYAGWTIHGGPTANPRTWTNNNDINCEHTWPQSLLSTTMAESDIHHLYPTEMQVNGARANLPFGEIPDNQVSTWYYNNTTTTTIPATNRDWYSRLLTGVKFQPRAAQKGNTARSMFYILTMYQQADTNASWWTVQRNDLYAWHAADPPDARELSRTQQIAAYQQNKVNPFVIDTTLVRRAYFPWLGVEGDGNNQFPIANADCRLGQNAPNPFKQLTAISYQLTAGGNASLKVYNVAGQKVRMLSDRQTASGKRTVLFDGRDDAGRRLPGGLYFYRLEGGNGVSVTNKMILIR